MGPWVESCRCFLPCWRSVRSQARVLLRSSKTRPVAYLSSDVQGTPRWRAIVRDTPLDSDLFPLHNPVNYVNWLGTQKKRLQALTVAQEGPRFGPGEGGGLDSSLRR